MVLPKLKSDEHYIWAFLEPREGLKYNNFQFIFNCLTFFLPFAAALQMGILKNGSPSYIRDRFVASHNNMTTLSALFVVACLTAFLLPPPVKTSTDQIYQNIFGCLMFFSTFGFMAYCWYMQFYLIPLVLNQRDEVVFDAIGVYVTKYAIFEIVLFAFTWFSMFIAILIAAYYVYSSTILWIILGETVVILTILNILIIGSGRSIDPICAAHEGFCDEVDLARAKYYSNEAINGLENDYLFMESGFGKNARYSHSMGEPSLSSKGSRKISIKQKAPEHDLPSLEEILIGPKCLLINNIEATHATIITEDDANNIYNCLQKAGCGSSIHLYNFLNDYYTSDDQRIKTLQTMNIPTFHAYELILFLRSIYLGKVRIKF